MPMRVTGLTSGLDTESIISALVSAYDVKTQKYTKAQTKLSWTQDAWKSLNTKVYSLYTNVSNLRFSSAYSTKKATVSDATKASVTASGSAVNGTQKLKINSTAQSAYMTGGKLQKADKTSEDPIDTKTTLSELGYTGKTTTFQVKKGNGETSYITVGKSSTITDVIASFKEAGVNVNFDENQGRLYLNANKSGTAGDFTIEPFADMYDGSEVAQYNKDSYSALYALGLASSSYASKVYNSVGASDMTLASEKTGSNLQISFKTPTSKEEAELQNKLLEKLKEDGSYQVITTANSDGSISATYSAGSDYVFENGKIYLSTDTNRANPIAEYQEKTDSAKLKEYSGADDVIAKDGGRRASFVETGIASDNVKITAENTGLNVEFHFNAPTSQAQADAQNAFVNALKTNGALRIETGSDDGNGNIPVTYKIDGYEIRDGKVYKEGDLDNPIGTYEESGTIVADTYDQKASLTAEGGSTASYQEIDSSHNPTMIHGVDASIELNGVEYTSATNDFSINGLNIKALAATTDEITISTDTDTQAIYDKIKDFITEYNNLINEMNKLYNADSSYGYDPLTDEEKDAMSDTEIEKWETKIKDSLLRNDSTLNGVMMAMMNAMSSTYEINGTKCNLSLFGISTLGYLNAAKNEQYAYHIDGDADDENTSGKEDKLMKAIKEKPDTVIELLKKITGDMYTALGDRMKSTSLSSAYTIYNDKEMNSQYSEYSKTISTWQDKLTEKEDYYYSKFSKMESAMAKLQSQTSSLSGLFGSSS